LPEPVIVELEPHPFAYISLTSTLDDTPNTMVNGFETLARLFASVEAAMAGNPLAHYLAFEVDIVDFDLGFPVLARDVQRLKGAGLLIGETPGGRCMVATHVGPYDSVSKTYTLMGKTMRALHVEGARDMWESYQSPPDTPPQEIRTEVIWPLLPSAEEATA
jgi:effector-binding domain-containing protein